MQSAINAHRNGVIGREELIRNIVLNGGNINPSEQLGNPVDVQINGREMIVTVNVRFSGNLVNEKFMGEDYTYKELFLSGVGEAWSGSIEDYDMTTIIKEQPDLAFKAIPVDISFGFAQDSQMTWNKERPISICFGDGIKKTSKYTKRNFIAVAAHEIGHSAFGLEDNVQDSRHSKVPLSKSIRTRDGDGLLMGDAMTSVIAAPVDLAFMVYNYQLSNFTKKIYYTDHTARLDQYSKGWIYGVSQY